jgi:high affinity sulfate transporter 1
MPKLSSTLVKLYYPTVKYDMIAGLSVAALLLPEAVAYSTIAGVTPEHAIFAAVLGLLAYAVVGKSNYAIVAPTSASAAILAAAVASFQDVSAADKLALSYGLVIFTGLFFMIGGAIKIGSIADFISRPVLRGFAFGLAVTIVIKQLPLIIGIHASGDVLQIIVQIVLHFKIWNVLSIAIGILTLLLLIFLKRWKSFPGVIVVLLLSVFVSQFYDLCETSISCVGPINFAMAIPGIPSVSTENWSRLGQLAIPLATILYAESWGSMRNYALHHNERLDPNKEMIALGIANIASGIMRGIAVGAGFSATSANEAAGAISRFSGVIAAVTIVFLILTCRPFISHLPDAALAAVVISALAHTLNPSPIIRLWRIKSDQYVATFAAVSVLVFGVLNGMLIAIALSIIAVLQRFSRPSVSRLGRLQNSRDYIDIRNHPEAMIDQEVHIYRPSAPMFFANCERIFSNIENYLDKAPRIKVVILSFEETNNLDSTSLDSLMEFTERLSRRNCHLLLARVKDDMRDFLIINGAHDLASHSRSFWSVADAADRASML